MAVNVMSSFQTEVEPSEQTESKDPEVIFDIIQTLHTSEHATLHKALDKRNDKVVVIKLIPEGEVELDLVKKQIQLLQSCNSPYTLNVYGSYTKDKKIWIVMEYCESGCIFDLMRVSGQHLNEGQ
eukprot:377713_1